MGKDKVDEGAIRTELDAIAALFSGLAALFGPDVLQGPAGVRLAQGMHERRHDLVALIASVSEDVARVNDSGFSHQPSMRAVPFLPRASEWVQIAPEAAERLRREMGSADGFVRHGKRLSGLFATVGGGPSVVACERTAAWCREQERDLRTRIEYARAADNIPVGLNGAGPGFFDFRRGLVTIPDWIRFGPDEKAGLAGLQARRLAGAYGKPAAQSRHDLLAVAGALRSHQNDPDYAAAFWRNVDPKHAAGLAGLLNKQDRDGGMEPAQVFTPESRQILAAFGNSLATKVSYKQPNGGTKEVTILPPEVRNGFVVAAKKDMWSAGMLFKYGPAGDKWDPALLSSMTTAVLAWRKTHVKTPPSVRSQSMPPEQPNSRVWYLERGIEPDLLMRGGKGAGDPAAQRSVAEHDPGAAILSRTGDNPQAARWALQDPAVVNNIMKADWTVTAFSYGQKVVDISNSAGKVLAAGVRADRGKSEEARQAAQVVVNVLAATHEWGAAKTSKDQQLPSGLRAGLRTVAVAYIPDLANSIATPGRLKNPTSPDRHKVSDSGVPQVESNNILVGTFLREAFTERAHLAEFRGSVQAHLVNTLRLNGGRSGDQETIDFATKLLRYADRAENATVLGNAKQKDLDAAERKAFFDTLTTSIGQVPTPPGKVFQGAQKVYGLAQPLMSAAYQTSKYEPKAKMFTRQSDYERQQHLRVLVVQALIARGDLIPPRDAAWYQDRQVVLGASFTEWFREHAHEHSLVNGKSVNDYTKDLAHTYQEPLP